MHSISFILLGTMAAASSIVADLHHTRVTTALASKFPLPQKRIPRARNVDVRGCRSITVTVTLTEFAFEAAWAIQDSVPRFSMPEFSYLSAGEYITSVCMAPGAYGFVGTDRAGDGWTAGSIFKVTLNGTVLVAPGTVQEWYTYVPFVVPEGNAHDEETAPASLPILQFPGGAVAYHKSPRILQNESFFGDAIAGNQTATSLRILTVEGDTASAIRLLTPLPNSQLLGWHWGAETSLASLSLLLVALSAQIVRHMLRKEGNVLFMLLSKTAALVGCLVQGLQMRVMNAMPVCRPSYDYLLWKWLRVIGGIWRLYGKLRQMGLESLEAKRRNRIAAEESLAWCKMLMGEIHFLRLQYHPVRRSWLPLATGVLGFLVALGLSASITTYASDINLSQAIPF